MDFACTIVVTIAPYSAAIYLMPGGKLNDGTGRPAILLDPGVAPFFSLRAPPVRSCSSRPVDVAMRRARDLCN